MLRGNLKPKLNVGTFKYLYCWFIKVLGLLFIVIRMTQKNQSGTRKLRVTVYIFEFMHLL